MTRGVTREGGPGKGPQRPRPLDGRRPVPPAAAPTAVREPEDMPPVRAARGLEENLAFLQRRLGYGESFDVIVRRLRLGDRDAAVVAIDGFVKDDVLLRALQFAASWQERGGGPEALFLSGLPYVEVTREEDLERVAHEVLAGQAALLLDGSDRVLLVDVRTFPARGPQEPELEKLVRGPHDGLVETLVFNTALIRRRLRDPQLRVERFQVGARSKTDVALLYIKDVADPGLVAEVRRRLQEARVSGLPMAEKSLEELILREKRPYNPFPTVRYTQRPDTVAVHLLEGHVAILTDTSPGAMLLPTTFWHHLQHATEHHDDYIPGTFIRLLRMFGLLVAWVLPPLWLALVLDKEVLPAWLQFLGPREEMVVPLGLQMLLANLAADMIWVALIHTPGGLSTSLGLIGAILVGEQAVRVGLFTNEVLLYTAIAFIGTFATPSIDLGNAIRVVRIALILLAWAFGLAGFAVGLLASLLLMASTRSLGVPYLWPLIPFDGQALKAVLLRRPLPQQRWRPALLHPRDPDVR